MGLRVGLGYDVHKLAENRKLIMGGVEISSLKLLGFVNDKVYEMGYSIVNIDSIIVAQAPKMRPYVDQMEKNIADVLGISVDDINVKATTEEELGFTGRKEGISSKAVCLLSK